MARYGIDYYGIAKYGSNVATTVAYDASPVTATSVGYGQILIKWSSPSGDWTRIRLIRNTYGFPLSVDDGATLHDEAAGAEISEHLDTGAIPNNIGLKQGISYHYSLFVYTTVDGWVNAGNVIGISVKNYGTLDSMLEALPNIYKTVTLNTPTDNSNNPALTSFLNIFALEHDLFKTNAELLYKTYDTGTAYAPIIPVMMQQFGLNYEPELGLQQSRILLRNSVYINKKKGSLDGIKDFVKAFTGYDQETKMSVNMMLDYNDSSFEESIGRWENIAKTTLSIVGDGVTVPYAEPSRPTLFPNKQAGSLKALCSAGGSMEFACGLTAPKTRGIPIKEGFPYTFSIYTKAASSARTVTVDVRWFDRNAVELSRAGEKNITNTTSWKRVETTSVAPVGAYFAIPYIRIDGASTSEIHYFDAAQFEVNAEGATSFQEAREIQITLKATRVNELTNPSFESGISPWTSTGSSLTIDTLIPDEDRLSASCLLIEATSNGHVETLFDKLMNVLPGYWYNMSGYLRTGFTGERADDFIGTFGVQWFDVNETFISEEEGVYGNLTEFYVVDRYYRNNDVLTVYTVETTSLSVGDAIRLVNFVNDITLNDEYEVTEVTGRYFKVLAPGDDFGSYVSPTECYVQDLKLDYVRNDHSFLSPENAKYAKVFFDWNNAVIGQELRLDSCMFERSSGVKPYFDGGSGFTSTDDLIWESLEVNTNRSHYYKNRVATQLRLTAQLPNYLVAGTPFSIYLAQPDA